MRRTRRVRDSKTRIDWKFQSHQLADFDSSQLCLECQWFLLRPVEICWYQGWWKFLKIANFYRWATIKKDSFSPVLPTPPLQWTIIGGPRSWPTHESPKSFTIAACFSLRCLRKVKKTVAVEGTPRSGQVKNCQCETLLVSFVWNYLIEYASKLIKLQLTSWFLISREDVL